MGIVTIHFCVDRYLLTVRHVHQKQLAGLPRGSRQNLSFRGSTDQVLGGIMSAIQLVSNKVLVGLRVSPPLEMRLVNAEDVFDLLRW